MCNGLRRDIGPVWAYRSLNGRSPGKRRPSVSDGPFGSEPPEVPKDIVTAAVSTDGLGVILDRPERLRPVFQAHDDLTVLLSVVRPCEGNDIG